MSKPKAHNTLIHPRIASWDFMIPAQFQYDSVSLAWRPLFRAPWPMRLRAVPSSAKQAAGQTAELYLVDASTVKTYASSYQQSAEVWTCWGNAPADTGFTMLAQTEFGDVIPKGELVCVILSSCLGSGPSGTAPGNCMITLHVERLDEE